MSLEFVDGEGRDETPLAEKLRDRTDIFVRLLHDETVAVRDQVRDALSKIGAVSYDEVRIEVSVQLADDPVSAPPTSAHAFYDIEEGRLTIRRPVGDRSWARILNALFHQLMPEATGSNISQADIGGSSPDGIVRGRGAPRTDGRRRAAS